MRSHQQTRKGKHRGGKQRGAKQRGAGVHTSQQWFDPTEFPPSAGLFDAPSSAATSTQIRPVLESTFQAGGRRSRTRRQRAGGVQMSQQWFDPAVYPPSAGLLSADVSTAATPNAVRPMLFSTFPTSGAMVGGTRRGRGRATMSGGFSPAIMGAFVENAKAVVVPLGLYLAYHTMVPKKDARKARTRKSSRK